MTHLFNRQFRKDQDGSMFAGGTILVIAMFIVGGFALDVSRAIKTRAELQATADAVAHTALYVRNAETASAAKTKALAVAEVMMPSSRHGNLLSAQDIQYGNWNAATKVFTPSSSSKNAVQVDVSRLQEKANGVSTYLLKFAGFSNFDIRNRAIYTTYQPPCLNEGFIADNIVDIQSNNSFANGFCIHANKHVEVNNNNSFESGVIVSMPSISDLVMPSSGFSKNDGLQTALRDAAYSLSILNDLPVMIEDLRTGGAIYKPSYITSSAVIQLNGNKFSANDFTQGRIHYIGCSGNKTFQLDSKNIYENIVLVTNCPVDLPANGKFYNVTIATTNTDAASIKTSAKLVLGLPDNCANGGGSTFLTLGGIRIAAQMEMSGSQMIARGNINFTAQGNGFYGASLISGGDISGTSNMTFASCNGAGTGEFHMADYFRMVL